MKKSILFLLLLAVSIGAVLAAVADVSGKWTGNLLGPDGNTYPLTYNFKSDGSKLTGTSETSFGVANIDNGKIKGDSLFFSVTLNGMDLPHKAKVYTDSISLNIDYNGTPLHATLKKAAK